MEVIKATGNVERGRTPFVRIAKQIVNSAIPRQVAAEKPLPAENSVALERRTGSFNIVLDEIDRQVYETPEGSFVWRSTAEKNEGVGFLATHIRITPELTRLIADKANIPEKRRRQNPYGEQRIKHEVCVVFPAYGLGRDGSGLSSMDLQIARVFNDLPKMADGATLDVLGVGLPRSLGGWVNKDFVARVLGANGRKYEGLGPYGEINAEFIKAMLYKLAEHYGYSSIGDFVKESRILFEGDALGAMIAGLTYNRLLKIMPEVADRQEVTIFQAEGEKPHEKKVTRGIQRLYINPAGIHGDNPLVQAANSLHMIYGIGIEAALRYVAGAVKTREFTTQPEFYEKMQRIKGIPPDDEEQKRLKLILSRIGEPMALGQGMRISRNRRSYGVTSMPDSLHTDLGIVVRGLVSGFGETLEGLKDRVFPGHRFEPHIRKALIARRQGPAIKFGVGYKGDMYMNLVKGFQDGSFNQKMAFVERRAA